jgi:glycosyltransferase involved in cell wall biosynthesis
MLRECRHVFANAQNTANRLAKFNGIDARALYHPPLLAGRLHAGRFDQYLLVVGRLETVKRIDLAIAALARIPPPTRLVIVGDGTQRAALERLAIDGGVAHRVTFAGTIVGEELVRQDADARAVSYTPFDEDFGYVTLEAFLSGKPVVTATDSGGPLEFVSDGENGFVCAPDADAIGAAMGRLAADEHLARRLGAAGQARARTVTWDGVLEQLLG